MNLTYSFRNFILSSMVALFPLAGLAEGNSVRDVQSLLLLLGYNPGPVDGAYGSKTVRALSKFYKDRGSKYDGILDDNEVTLLKREIASEYKKTGEHQEVNTFGGRLQIPSGLDYQLNDATLEHFFKINQRSITNESQKLKIAPSKSPFQFKSRLLDSAAARNELATSAILSYLYYEDGYVLYDMLPPEERFSVKIDDESYFPSHSIGKSLVSYMIGHAICDGYIASIDDPVKDWPLIEGTLYHEQPLIALLNMTAGDTNVIAPLSGSFIKTGRSIHGDGPLIKATKNPRELANTKSDGIHKFAYSNLTADVLMNYLMHRVGQDFESFVEKIFQDKVGISNPIYLWMNPIRGSQSNLMSKRIKQGAGQYAIDATRYDYLRIARAILLDWNNDTCVGSYLKSIYERRLIVPRSRDNPVDRWDGSMRRWGDPQFGTLTHGYAGQFWVELEGFRQRKILIMIGADGQNIAIDTDKSRIIVINSGQEGFGDFQKLAYEPLRYGKIRE